MSKGEGSKQTSKQAEGKNEIRRQTSARKRSRIKEIPCNHKLSSRPISPRHYGPEQKKIHIKNSHLSHKLGGEWASERGNEWTQQSARARQAERSEQCGARKRVSGASKQAKRQASGPVFLSGFLVILDHSARVFSSSFWPGTPSRNPHYTCEVQTPLSQFPIPFLHSPINPLPFRTLSGRQTVKSQWILVTLLVVWGIGVLFLLKSIRVGPSSRLLLVHYDVSLSLFCSCAFPTFSIPGIIIKRFFLFAFEITGTTSYGQSWAELFAKSLPVSLIWKSKSFSGSDWMSRSLKSYFRKKPDLSVARSCLQQHEAVYCNKKQHAAA